MKKLLVGIVLLPLGAFAAGGEDRYIGGSQPSAPSQMGQPSPMGQPPPPATAPSVTGAALSAGDRDFVMKAASGGMYKVEAARLALEKSKDDKVRSTAQHLLDDHQAANDKLKNIAATEGVALPTSMLPEQQQMLDKLRDLSGKDFDKEYLRQQKEAHTQAISLFEKESSAGQDPALKSFAQQTLPTLRQHKMMMMK